MATLDTLNPVKPNAAQWAKLVTFDPQLAYTPAQKALVVFLACEAFTPDVAPWKLNALRTVLTTQDDVEAFRVLLVALAEQQHMTILGDAELKDAIQLCVAGTNATDWVLAQQQAQPVKHIVRTLLIGKNLLDRFKKLEELGAVVNYEEEEAGSGLPLLSTVLGFPWHWRAEHGPNGVATPTLNIFDGEDASNIGDYSSYWSWLLQEDSGNYLSYDYGSVHYNLAEPPAKPAVGKVVVKTLGGPTVVPAPAPVVAPTADPAALSLLKTAIQTSIKAEVNDLLGANKIADLVAKQIASNPLSIQQALVKVFSVSTNQTSSAAFTQAANEAIKAFMETQGATFIANTVGNYLKTNLNVSKIETEAIKNLNANVDGYFASIFNRVVVKDGAGNVLGHLGFKDTTQLKAPMPKHGLAAKLEAADGGGSTEDIPF